MVLGVRLSVCVTTAAVRPFNERVPGCFYVEDLSQPYYTLLLSIGYDPSNSGNGLGASQVSTKLTDTSQTSLESCLADRDAGLKPRSY